jgi:PAS domain S-box-containing protein
MNKLEFNFSDDSFNRLFPFYILIDKSLQIENFGKSLVKICPFIKKSTPFSENFSIKKPRLDNPTYEDIINNSNQLTVIENKINGIPLRGQFELINNSLLFVGSPWFNSTLEVVENKLTFRDFALHDPLIDLLHVLNNQENNSKELKELLMVVNNQKNKLKQANKEIDNIALFPTKNPDPLIRIDVKGNIINKNPAAEKLTILEYEGISYETNDFFKFIIHKIDLDQERFTFEAKAETKDFSFICKSLKEEGYVNIYGRDITEQKKDQAELRRLSLVASINENGIVFTHKNGKIFWCNDSYLKLTGYSIEEVIGKTPIEIGKIEGSDLEDLEKMLIPFYKGEPFDIEHLHRKKNGENFWVKTKGQPILNSNNEVIQYFAMIEDITQKKEQDERLYLLSLIAEKNINSVVICDKLGRIEWVNESFLNLSEYTFEEAVGQVPGHLLQGPETKPETVEYLKNQVMQGSSFECEIVNYSKSGYKYWIRLQGQALLDRKGKISKYFAVEENITAKKELENQKEELMESLAKSNKDLEDYASIVSHDLKSPLRSIHSLLTWIKEDNDKEFNEQTLKYLNMIEGKVEKMDHLIGGILTYAKIDKGDFVEENVNVHQIIETIISIIDIPKNVNIIIKNQLPFIQADRFRIQQLFQNIIGNAVIYVDKPEGLVEVGSEEFEDHYVFFIKDNGPGIAKENQEKIFNVFQSFTTSDRSTGIGLSIVKKIIETYNGKIWIESELGIGTTFFIQLNK